MKLRKLALLLILVLSIAWWPLFAIESAGNGNNISDAISQASKYLVSLLDDEDQIEFAYSVSDFLIAYWFLIVVALAALAPIAAAICVLLETASSIWLRLLWVLSFLFLSIPAIQIYCCLRLYALRSGKAGPKATTPESLTTS